MGTSQDPVIITPAQLTGVLSLLKQVGLDDAAAPAFQEAFLAGENYTGGALFEWTQAQAGTRFFVERLADVDVFGCGRIIKLYVIDLRQYSGTPELFSHELIVDVNRKLRRMFIKGYPSEQELAGLEKITVVETYYRGDDSSVLVLRASGELLRIPLWQLAGRTRLSDEYNDWKFQDSGEVPSEELLRSILGD